MKLNFSKYITIAAGIALLWSCKGNPQWHVDGRIEGAEGETMYVEGSVNGRWYTIDYVTLNSSGDFAFAADAAGYPDIYRLRLADKSLYFPIDSIETVTVMAKAGSFDLDYTIEGTPAAEQLMAVDRKVMDAANKNGAASLPGDSLLKRELSTMLLNDPSGIVSYYIINKKIAGVPLFDPANKNDLRIIGAVANAYSAYRPTDPRTEYLKHLYLQRKRVTLPGDTIMANETTIIDVNLYDRKGVKQSLEKVAKDNRVVLLSFTAYGEEYSPALNIELNKLYSRYHSQGLEIYQIGFDQNEYDWRQTASNLPWITVYNASTDGPLVLRNYNVTSLPAMYVIQNGEIRERLTDATKLEQSVSKYM